MTKPTWRDVDSERIWRCQCGGMHFVSVKRSYWNTEDEYCCYFTLEDADRYNGLSWRERLVVAWHALRGQFHSWNQVTMTPQMAREISEELLLAASEQEQWEAENAKKGVA